MNFQPTDAPQPVNEQMLRICTSAPVAENRMLYEVPGNIENLFFNYKLKTMSEFKGTKGKWYFSDQDFKVRGTGDIEGMTVIANVSPKMDYSRGSGTQHANGRLIAAAPDLLEVLKVCWNSLQTYGEHPIIKKQIESVISKAVD